MMKEGAVYEWAMKKNLGSNRSRALLMLLVCNEFNCTNKELRGSSRKRNLVDARGVFAHLCKKHLRDTRIRIGMELQRDQSSITIRLQKIADYIDIKDSIVKQIENIENKFLNQ